MDVTRNPEIQRLLANLRRSTSENGTSTAPQSGGGISHEQPAAHQFATTTATTVNNLPGLGLPFHEDAASTDRGNVSFNQPRHPVPLQPKPQQHPLLPPSSPSPLARTYKDVLRERSLLQFIPAPTPIPIPIPDASSITTWPAALKHIMLYITPDSHTATKIRHLVAEQHKHERQWWNGREAITTRHTSRADNQQKAADLLRSLGGLTTLPSIASDPAAEKAELDAYDKKVHRGMTEMAADFDRQLRNLGIPFYCIKHGLVILEEGEEKEGEEMKEKRRIDRGELRELQKKIIQTLEDLFL